MNRSLSANSLKCINIYFQVHQPRRLAKFQLSDIGTGISPFDDKLNAAIIKRIAEECYLPANRLLLTLIDKFPELRFTFSISGSALDQLLAYAPQVIKSFQKLAATGAVEFLGETYFNSLSYLIDRNEFVGQVNKHRSVIADLFGRRPTIFRNTDLLYCDSIGDAISDMGFEGVYIDGVERVLQGRTTNTVYNHPASNVLIFPRNYILSDDIAFRYSDASAKEGPLTVGKFVDRIRHNLRSEQFLSVGLAYETFGEHKKASVGIFDFLENVIAQIAAAKDMQFVTLKGASELLQPEGVITTQKMISWAGEKKDLSAWLGGELQKIAFDSLCRLYPRIKNIICSKLIKAYRHLTASDHFYYMSTNTGEDYAVVDAVNPYRSAHEAFKSYMNILADLELQISRSGKKTNYWGHGPETGVHSNQYAIPELEMRATRRKQ